MNPFPDDPELEGWLREMPLVQPSASLDRRVLGPALWRSWPRWAVGAAAAAAVAAFVLLRHEPADVPPDRDANRIAVSAPAPAAPQVPVSPAALPKDVEETFTRVSYIGLRYLDEGTPVQEYRQESVRRVWKFDPAQGVETLQVVPVEEEVILVRADTL